MALGKVSGIDWANLASVAGVAKANIAKVAGVEVPAASGAVLDSYTGAGVAHALFQLYSSYTGNLIRVYRDSDASTLDVGFDGSGDLDTAAIESFCSGTTGRVITLYDQSGNGYNLAYASGTRAVIYESGAVLTLNGMPYIRITNGFAQLRNSSVDASDLVGVNESYVIIAGGINSGGSITFESLPFLLSLNSSVSQIAINSSSAQTFNTAQSYTAGVQYIGEGLYVDDITNPDIYVDDSLLSEVFGTSGAYTGSGTETVSVGGHFQAAIAWPFDQSANRSGIYTAIYNKLNGI